MTETNLLLSVVASVASITSVILSAGTYWCVLKLAGKFKVHKEETELDKIFIDH